MESHLNQQNTALRPGTLRDLSLDTKAAAREREKMGSMGRTPAGVLKGRCHKASNPDSFIPDPQSFMANILV